MRLERKRLEEVGAMCYSYRDYREEEARKRRQEELSRRREKEARRVRKKSTDRERVLVKS